MRGEFVLTDSHNSVFPRPFLFSFRQFVFAFFVLLAFAPFCPYFPIVNYLSTIIPDVDRL